MSTKEENVIVKIREEQEDDYSDDDLYNISSWGADLSFREIVTMYDEGELVKPEMQRHYVWDKTEASRFIESLLMGLPVPSIFFARSDGEKKLIVDGYQRIMSVRDYIRGIFSGDGKVFKLSNSEKINKRWRGKAFSELPEESQRRIKSTTIHAIIFEQKHPKQDDTSLFQVFERINTGGRSLTAQEIRNCVYQGRFNTLLIEINKYPKWRDLYGLKVLDTRMRDIEFILRFFALSSPEMLGKTDGKISLKKHLSNAMGKLNEETDQVTHAMGERFKLCINTLHDIFGVSAFQNFSDKESEYIEKFHPTIYDSIAIATDIATARGVLIKNIVDLHERKKKLLTDDSYKQQIRLETMTHAHIRGRISKALFVLYGETL